MMKLLNAPNNSTEIKFGDVARLITPFGSLQAGSIVLVVRSDKAYSFIRKGSAKRYIGFWVPTHALKVLMRKK